MRKGIIALAAVFAASIAWGSDWPPKPIRFIVPYPPGGGTDVIARILQSQLSGSLGQSVIIESRESGRRVPGTEGAAKANPGDHSLPFTPSSHAVTPVVHQGNYDG